MDKSSVITPNTEQPKERLECDWKVENVVFIQRQCWHAFLSKPPVDLAISVSKQV